MKPDLALNMHSHKPPSVTDSKTDSVATPAPTHLSGQLSSETEVPLFV